jgi:hypothetical protein
MTPWFPGGAGFCYRRKAITRLVRPRVTAPDDYRACAHPLSRRLLPRPGGGVGVTPEIEDLRLS